MDNGCWEAGGYKQSKYDKGLPMPETVQLAAFNPNPQTVTEEAKACIGTLILTLDNSSSDAPYWNDAVYEHASAVVHPDIVSLIEREGPVLFKVTAFDNDAQPMVDWRLVRNQGDAFQLAGEILQAGNHVNNEPKRRTEAQDAIMDALISFDSPEKQRLCPGGLNIVDLFSDGRITFIERTKIARDLADARGTVINGLALETGPHVSDGVYKGTRDAMDRHEHYIITTTGRVIPANSGDIGVRLRQKLVMEIGQMADHADIMQAQTPNDAPAHGLPPQRQHATAGAEI